MMYRHSPDVMPREGGASSTHPRCGEATTLAFTGSSAFADDDSQGKS
jgi:hypothetical protein